MSSAQWLYLKIGAPSVYSAESMLRQVVTPILKARGYLQAYSQSSWFFIRYLDATGLHLRLRVWDQSDRLCELEKALREALMLWQNSFHHEVNYVRRAVYFPEWIKWGGHEGVIRAEKVFATSSRLALAMPQNYWKERHALAMLLMRRGVEMLPPMQQLSFIYNYAWYWSGTNDPTLPTMQEALRQGARRAAHYLGEQMEAWECSSGEWRTHMELYLNALEQDLNQTENPGHRLFNHLHLTSNRLGVSPRDEALLAEVLRLRHSTYPDYKESP